MNRPFAYRVSPVAALQIREAAIWWSQHREKAPGAVAQELGKALALVTAHPDVGVRARKSKLAGVRRLFLSRIRYYLFYSVHPEAGVVEVLAFWHASRGQKPF